MLRIFVSCGFVAAFLILTCTTVFAGWTCEYDSCVEKPPGDELLGKSMCCDGARELHEGDCTADDPASAYTCQKVKYVWSDYHDGDCNEPNKNGNRGCHEADVTRTTWSGNCGGSLGCLYFVVPGSSKTFQTSRCHVCA